MLQVHFTTVNGNPGYRTLTENDKIDAGATHLFRELRNGKWITRGRVLTGDSPWVAANYIRAAVKNGNRIELIGTF